MQNNLENAHLIFLQVALLIRELASLSSADQSKSKTDHLMKQGWCLSGDHFEQTARQSRSLRQMLSTNKFSTRKWSMMIQLQRS